MDARERQRLVFHSTFTALLVALVFLGVGRLVFGWLGITIDDFLIAGGTILFIIAIRDLLSFGKNPGLPAESIGVVPLAVPLMVGPAVLTTSLIIMNSYGVFPTVTSIVTNVVLCGLILSFASRLSGLLGQAGSNTVSKISNLLLAAIAVMLIRKGLTGFLS
jgi:multiple antibiotic resistance protein